MTSIDLLIKAHSVLQFDDSHEGAKPKPRAETNWALGIKDRHIVALGPHAEIAAEHQASATLELPNHLLMPGLINLQSHALGIIDRGNNRGVDVFSGPLGAIDKSMAVLADEELMAAAQLAFTEMLMAGTTTCADMSLHSEWVAKAAEASGIHAQISVPVSDDDNAWTHGAQQALDRALAMHDTYAHHPRIGIAIGLPDLSKIDHATLVKVATYALELNLGVQVLLHQSSAHVLAVEKRHGCNGIQLLDQVGLLGPSLQAVHMNALDDDDIALLRHHRVALVRCHHPFENQMRRWDWLSPGQPLALGTGGYGLNYYADLFRSIERHGSSGIFPATLGGAEVMGLDENIGSLVAGKLADIIAADLRILDARIHADTAVVDLVNLLTQGRASQAVTHVWVAGNMRV
ncbi:MAG: amidohydrolase family protein, partial [Pseudomonadales bacterium]|nr:amidohydrolase family protein [Pseudomonadales bacterium]